MPTPFDYAKPSTRAARQILLDGITANPPVDDINGEFAPFMESSGEKNHEILAFAIRKAFWELFLEGILAPGKDAINRDLPSFHVTEYGRTVLAADPAHPHDPERYLARITQRVATFDPTVRSYLVESLGTFKRGNLVASAVMLGIAAERAFLLLCESVRDALSEPREKTRFTRILDAFPMKAKLEWIEKKFQEKSVRALDGFPDNARVLILAVYDFLRVQRNEFGHPGQAPPSVDREDAFANLQVFARYYETVEKIRALLAGNGI